MTRLKPVLDTEGIIPEHQFGFRTGHGTVEQVHRLVEAIHSTFEDGQSCTGAFLDVSQAFDRVWHQGLAYKIKKNLPYSFYPILQSFLTNKAARNPGSNKYGRVCLRAVSWDHYCDLRR